jgi:hypothetical protein
MMGLGKSGGKLHINAVSQFLKHRSRGMRCDEAIQKRDRDSAEGHSTRQSILRTAVGYVTIIDGYLETWSIRLFSYTWFGE